MKTTAAWSCSPFGTLAGRPESFRLYEWLNRAADEKRILREGAGRPADPYRYRLPNADDKYWDRGELPPSSERLYQAALLCYTL